MKPWVKVAVVTALFAVPAMALGQVIWPPAPGGPEPSTGQLPFFILLAVFEALTFGLGVSSDSPHCVGRWVRRGGHGRST
jgi:hypothetical protein